MKGRKKLHELFADIGYVNILLLRLALVFLVLVYFGNIRENNLIKFKTSLILTLRTCSS